jgi:single-strand DNA-binding protein
MQDINTVAITANLTRDPELIQTEKGSICKMRVANNGRKKVGEEWVDAPNFFDVVVWGAQGENAAQYLSKGRKVGITGTLRWREWEQDDGQKRQGVEIHANNVAFMGGKDEGNGASPNASTPVAASTTASDDIPF